MQQRHWGGEWLRRRLRSTKPQRIATTESHNRWPQQNPKRRNGGHEITAGALPSGTFHRDSMPDGRSRSLLGVSLARSAICAAWWSIPSVSALSFISIQLEARRPTTTSAPTRSTEHFISAPTAADNERPKWSPTDPYRQHTPGP